MKAFLKRRWILFSCAVVLLLFTMVRWFPDSWGTGFASFGFSVDRGDMIFTISTGTEDYMFRKPKLGPGIRIAQRKNLHLVNGLHAPMLGTKPEILTALGLSGISIPLWLPLAVVIGWIVIRELRWRERCAKTAEVIAP